MDPVFLLLFLYYSFDHIKKKNPSELLMVSLSFSLFSLSLSSWASTKKSRLDITEISSAETLMHVDNRLLCGGGEPSHVCPASLHSCLISCCLFGVEMRPPGPSWNVSVWRCPAQWNDVWKDYYVLRTNVMREGLTYLWAILTTYYTIRNAWGCLSKRSSIRSLSLSLSLASLLMVSTFTTLRDLEKHWIAILVFLKVTQWLAWANNFGVLGVTL
jgi:hypothetical protein